MPESNSIPEIIAPAHTWLIVPCFNEAARLRGDEFIQFVRDYPGIHILFVNDGSTDSTHSVLRELVVRGGAGLSVLALPHNSGKAEAVRAGFQHAFKQEPLFIGYWDADLATPLSELPQFIAMLQTETDTQMVLGARVQLLGRQIRRKLSRHYIGRAFATFASLYLGLRIYDTQCGAKLFRNTQLLREIFAKPWTARWLFDVELLVRYLKSVGAQIENNTNYGIHEIPLNTWEDVKGSKIRVRDFFKACFELLRIMWNYGQPLNKQDTVRSVASTHHSHTERDTP